MTFKIKHNLFLTLLLTSIVVSSGMFVFMQWSFDRGFLNYVNSQKVEGLNRLSASLIDQYRRHGDWQFLQGNEQLWRQLIKAADRNMNPSRPDEPESQPPPRQLTPGYALFSADKKQIFAPLGGAEHLQLTPLDFQGKTIGYLALVPVKEISDAGDLLFVEQQTDSFALIALAMALLSLLLSYPLTIHLLRPIKELTKGTHALISGQFTTRIPVTTRDELGQLSNDFNTLAITLEKNEQARQQWVADISHELRTPLAVLRGEIEALQDGIRQPGAQTFDVLHSEVMHLGRLVDDLYELSMSDIGALNYKKIRVDPVGILKGTIELFEPRFAEKRLQLRSGLPNDVSFSLLADPDRLQQLFSNVLENSLRYTDSPGQLSIRMKTDTNRLVLTFEDSAPGVPKEHIPKLFERLHRVEVSRNRDKGGAGLGLAICSNIVEAHQGEISASASVHGGLAITITFPMQG